MSLMCFVRILLNHSTKSETSISAKSRMLQSFFFFFFEQLHTDRDDGNTETEPVGGIVQQEEGNVSDVHIFLPLKPAGLGHVCHLS